MIIDTVTSKNDLKKMFKRLGMKREHDVFVHSSMKSLGYVVNGANDVIDALLETVGENGTILMPAHTGQLTDPRGWLHPFVPSKFVSKVRKNMKPLCQSTTIRNRGIVAQTFLTYDSVWRSCHPLNSVIAVGLNSDCFTCEHNLDDSEGVSSPIFKLYEAQGYVLLIGVDLTKCTAIHLAEYLADVPYLYETKIRVLYNGKFVKLNKYPNGSEHFNKVRKEAEVKKYFKEIKTAKGVMTYFPIKPVIDFIVNKLKDNPKYLVTA